MEILWLVPMKTDDRTIGKLLIQQLDSGKAAGRFEHSTITEPFARLIRLSFTRKQNDCMP